QATTSSLEALKAYSSGRAQQISARHSDAIPFFKRAIELDSNFASAYTGLSVSYNQIQQHALGAQFAEKAFALRDRVSEHEKLNISANYYNYVTGEWDKMVETEDIRKQTYPREYDAPNGLAVAYRFTGQGEKAIEE